MLFVCCYKNAIVCVAMMTLYVILVFCRESAMVVVGSHSHQVAAIDLMSGKLVWQVCLPDRVESSACLSRCAKYVLVGKIKLSLQIMFL